MSATEFEFNLRSPAFEEFNNDLNVAILQCVHEIHNGTFAGGDISAKIGIELINDSEIYVRKGKEIGGVEIGEPRKEVYSYKKPVIDYKVTLTLKRRGESKGSYEPVGMELKKGDDERFIMQKVKTAQLSIEDMEG